MSEHDPIEKVLLERARLFAQRTSDEARAPQQRALVLQVGGERYALALRDVLQIDTAKGVTPLPGAPLALAGIANFRGAVYSVMDLAQIFTGTTGSSAGGRLVFLRNGGMRLALLVEGVESIALYEEVRPLEAAAAHLEGMISPGLPLIDLSALLRHPAFTSGRKHKT